MCVCVCLRACVFMCVYECEIAALTAVFFPSILQLHSFDHILDRATKNHFRQSSVWEQVLGKEEALVSSDEDIK